MSSVFVSVLFLVALALRAEAQRVAVATFNAGGITGDITFTEVGDNVEINVNLAGLTGNHGWHVHTLPIDQTVDPSYQCLGGSAGPHYDPFNENTDDDYAQRCAANGTRCEAGDLAGKFGPIPASGQMMYTDSTGTLFLRDQYSIIGRSAVIHDAATGANFECGTLRSMTEIDGAGVTLLQSTFVFPIGGTIYFRQVEGEDVQIWGKFYWVNDMATTFNHNWHIHSLAPGEEYRLGDCDTSGNIMGHYRPLGNGPTSIDDYDTLCTPAITSGCEVGDLTGKHDQLTIQAVPSPYNVDSFFYTDNFLNLTGENPVVNRSVAIHEPDGGGPVVACAPLVPSENIVLTRYSSEDITISQGSPFEDTVITSINTRTETVVEDFPFTQLNLNCASSPDAVFSPYEPVDGVDTPDGLSLGDLQNRYEDIGGAGTQRVFDVPVYGANTSISSLNIRTVSAGVSSCCALVPPLTGDNIILAKASFSRVVRGAVYLVQEDFGFDQLGNTHIIVDTYYADPCTTPTVGHNWHVHEEASPSADTTCSPTVGGHYNPYDVSLATTTSDPLAVNSDYSTDCSPRYQLRCESGDLTGKHGQLDISPNGPTRPTYTYVDSNLQLTGRFSIIGRSIAIHDNTGELPIFDCGTIEQVYLSNVVVVARIDVGDAVRTSVTSVLANEIPNLDSTDLLVLNQEVMTIEFGFMCVEVSMRVLASSSAVADEYATTLNTRVEDLFTCDGTATTDAPVTCPSGALQSAVITQATYVLPLLLTVLYIMGTPKY